MSENNGELETCLSKLRKVIDGKRSVALFTHYGPDPDGIGSMMGLQWLLAKYGIQASLFYDGIISHPQNIAMTNLLDPGLLNIEEYKGAEYDLNILLDTIPSYAGINGVELEFDIVIDHHKEVPNNGFDGLYLNLKAGSCCGTVWDLIDKSGFKFEDDNESDSRVATAMLVGIATDTEHMMSEDATEYEFRAWKELFEVKNGPILRKIINYARPKFWIETEAEAVNKVDVTDGLAIVGLGIIPAKHRDMIADMAQRLATWEDVQTAIAFAIIDGDRIEGSVRSNNASVIVTDLCKKLGGKHGNGGGKLGKGAYRYALGGGAIDDDDDPEIKEKLWGVFAEKEERRILRVISK